MENVFFSLIENGFLSETSFNTFMNINNVFPLKILVYKEFLGAQITNVGLPICSESNKTDDIKKIRWRKLYETSTRQMATVHRNRFQQSREIRCEWGQRKVKQNFYVFRCNYFLDGAMPKGPVTASKLSPFIKLSFFLFWRKWGREIQRRCLIFGPPLSTLHK